MSASTENFEKTRRTGFRSGGGPKRSSQGGLPHSVLRSMRERAVTRAKDIIHMSKGAWPERLKAIEDRSAYCHEGIEPDFWCLLTNGRRLPVKVTLSAQELVAHFQQNKGKGTFYVGLVVHKYKPITEIFWSFCESFERVIKLMSQRHFSM